MLCISLLSETLNILVSTNKLLNVSPFEHEASVGLCTHNLARLLGDELRVSPAKSPLIEVLLSVIDSYSSLTLDLLFFWFLSYIENVIVNLSLSPLASNIYRRISTIE